MTIHRFTYTSTAESQTANFGGALGALLRPGMVVALNGPLGAGKTRLVRAMVEGLGGDPDLVSSPTFVLIHEYEARVPVYHFDTYRLGDAEEFLELGASELLSGDGVCLVEWAERVTDELPRDRVTLQIEISGPSSRTIHVSAMGAAEVALLHKLQQTMAPTSPTSPHDSEEPRG